MYRNCAEGKCFKALRSREGAFNIYKSKKLKLLDIQHAEVAPVATLNIHLKKWKRTAQQLYIL